jgi:putative DNA primase/helicase
MGAMAVADVNTLLAAALDYARKVKVFPLHSTNAAGRCSCGRADCDSPGKHPRTAHGHLEATDDPERIREWWTRWPAANIGLACGASGRGVVDVDERDGRPGLDNWFALKQELRVELEETAIVETPSGGLHIHFLAAGRRIGSGNDLLGAGIDVKGEGGYVLLPPSAIAGVEYAWVDGHGLEQTTVIPAALAERLEFVASQNGSGRRSGQIGAGAEIPGGRRNETLFRDACAMRRRGHTRQEIQAAISEKNKRCSPPLSAVEVRHIVESASRYEPAEGEEKRLAFHRTDAGNAELFRELYGDTLRFDHRRGTWSVWGEHHWAEDGDGAVYRLAVQAARQRYQMALQIADLSAREDESKFAIASENRQRLEAMLCLAGRLLPITTAGDAWNRDPNLLCAANGVIDLRSGRLRAGRPDELISYYSDVPFEADACCPRWEQFLCEIFLDDEELIDWIWRVVGYLHTGLTSEQCFFLCYGVGANGKSRFLNILRALLGLYAYNAPFATFESQARAQIPNDLAALVNRRLVTASETNDDTRLNEARMKMLTGGDPTTARFLHREFFTFVPVAKFVLAANHKPRIRDYSHGFWRRMRLIPFQARFEGDADDKHLEEKLLGELPGILAWAVRGCLEWQRRGLEPPKAVRAATADYRADSDPLAEFLAERCLPEEGSVTKAAATYDAYRDWAGKQGLTDKERLGRNRFFELLESHFRKTHSNAGNLYHGLRLRDPATPTLDEQ